MGSCPTNYAKTGGSNGPFATVCVFCNGNNVNFTRNMRITVSMLAHTYGE